MVRSSPVTPLPRRATNTLSRSSILIKLTTRKTPAPLVTHTLTQLGLTFFNLDCDEDSSLVFIAHRGKTEVREQKSEVRSGLYLTSDL